MSWMITGGAGYIGAHVARTMRAAGEPVLAYDDLSTGDAGRLPPDVPLVTGSVLDRERLDAVLADHGVTGVIHIAAKKQAGESVEQPLRYYQENVNGLHTVLSAMVGAGVDRLVFSSSAAAYGMPDVELVTEDTPCLPMSPYGETKLAGERMVRSVGLAHGLRSASLRYFNVAGAASPELGDPGVFNLVPMVFERLDAGLPPLVFGEDYPTPDGTCVRDYIHVTDVATAHLAAARRIVDLPAGSDLTVNVGRGEGLSVREVVDRIGRVTGRDTTPEVTARRAGDPARVVASADRAGRELGWTAEYDMDTMIASAWDAWRYHRPDRT